MSFTKAIVKATGAIVTIDTGSRLTSNHGTIYRTADKQHTFFDSELEMFDDCDYWEFICRWLPNYTSSQRVAESNDLSVCLDGEADEDKLAEVARWCGTTREEWVAELVRLDAMLFEDALRNYAEQKYLQKRD